MANAPLGAALLLAFIRSTETGRKDQSAYTTIYGHNEAKLAKPVTSMTVDQVIAAGPGWTKAYKSSAAGAYQFMSATLKDLKASEGLTGGETFTPALQDRLGLARAGFIAGTIGRNAFGLGLAREWASFPVLADVKGAHRAVRRGETYYAGDKLNQALVKPEAVETVLTQVKLSASSPQELAPPVSPEQGAKSGPPWRAIFITIIILAAIGAAFFLSTQVRF